MPKEKKETTKKKAGRPSIYSDELALEICTRIGRGQSLKKITDDPNMPDDNTVYKWIHTDVNGFKDKYARACEERSEAMAEDILSIADDGTNDWMTVEGKNGNEYQVVNNEAMQRSRLRIETRKWLMAKTKPKKYGDKIDVTSDGKALPTPIYGGMSGDTTPDK
jgi:hypothetical protein